MIQELCACNLGKSTRNELLEDVEDLELNLLKQLLKSVRNLIRKLDYGNQQSQFTRRLIEYQLSPTFN